jgi:hypothetical protein
VKDKKSEIEGQPNEGGAAQQDEAELAEAILEYLSEYPHAMDTLEGIAEWWVMREQVRVEVDALVRVLQQLTKDGLLEEIGPDDNPRYRLRSQTMPEE